MSIPKLLNIKKDIYPIGSIYISLNSTEPATLFGGVWERIKDRFMMPAGDIYVADSTGGSAEQTLLVENMPTHTHTRGTMDIIGKIRCYSDYNYKNDDYWKEGVSGPFYKGYSNYDGETGSSNNQSASATADAVRTVSFQASRAWTGETSSEGGGASFSVIPPYITVYAWKRIA